MFRPVFTLSAQRGFEADLQNASKEIRTDVDIACRTTAFAVKNRAKAEAETFSDRGDLARSIAAQGKNMNYAVGILDVSLPSRGGRNTAHWNPWVYGTWYELGFASRNIAAHPFIRPAAEAEDEAHVQRVDAALGRALVPAA